MYIFPGIGFGSILCKARLVTDGMVEQSSIALATALNPEELAGELVYPRLLRIRDISAKIALAVIRKAQADVSIVVFILRESFVWLTVCSWQNVDENVLLRDLSDDALLQYVKIKMWAPPNGGNGPSRL